MPVIEPLQNAEQPRIVETNDDDDDDNSADENNVHDTDENGNDNGDPIQRAYDRVAEAAAQGVKTVINIASGLSKEAIKTIEHGTFGANFTSS